MTTHGVQLKKEILRELADLEKKPCSRERLVSWAEKFIDYKKTRNFTGFFKTPQTMLTATIDDGLGMGIELISLYAKVAGIDIIKLGIMLSAEEIIEGCNRYMPDYLGLTVLQFDTQDELIKIADKIDKNIKIIAGGPVFSLNTNFLKESKVNYTAKNAPDFLRIIIKISEDLM